VRSATVPGLPPLDLGIVIPAYNEEACIEHVVRSWLATLDGCGMAYRIMVLNDGSTDGTGSALRAFAGDPRVELIDKENSGHGPTILVGYGLATGRASWVFQCDGDDEMPPDAFPALWAARNDYDALFGYRDPRLRTPERAFISAVSRLLVGLLYGARVRDVNTPYRLLRASVLSVILPYLPGDTFAPNVAISGAVARARLRVLNVPVGYRQRRTGAVSIAKWGLWKSALRAAAQTVMLRPAMGRAAKRLGGAR
jgi:dolichol-phosphate mannosyltransferase